MNLQRNSPLLRAGIRALFAGLPLLCGLRPAAGQPALTAVFSPMTGLPGGAPIRTASDHDILLLSPPADWSAALPALTEMLGAEAPHCALAGVAFTAPGEVHFTLDSAARIGGTACGPGDVLRWNGGTVTRVWSGASNGLPPGAGIDALEILTASPLSFVFSLETAARLTIGGVSTLLQDEDAALYEAGSGFTRVVFRGADHGIPAEADLDALSAGIEGPWLMSFDIPGLLPGTATRSGFPLAHGDGDLLLYDPFFAQFTGALAFDSAIAGIPPGIDLIATSPYPGPETLGSRVKAHLLGKSAAAEGLDLNGDMAVDSADLIQAGE